MFISTGILSIQYGVDDKIAKFFVDREPPAGNLYWKDKYLYLQPTSGYLFIPLIIDLLFKSGIERNVLLSEEPISCMENVGHICALEETKQITPRAAFRSCIALARANCNNETWLNAVVNYFKETPGNLFSAIAAPFKALHRGDVFLFSLSAINFREELFEKIAQQWFALVSSLLLLDDVEDLDNDRKNNEENALLESGLDKEGIERIEGLMQHNLHIISSVNSVMAMKLNKQFIELIERLHVHTLINKN